MKFGIMRWSEYPLHEDIYKYYPQYKMWVHVFCGLHPAWGQRCLTPRHLPRGTKFTRYISRLPKDIEEEVMDNIRRQEYLDKWGW